MIEQSPLRGRRLSTFGWVTLTLGSGWLLISVNSTLDGVLQAAGLVLVVAGIWAIRRGRQHLTPVLTSLQDLPADEQTVLFLRAFTDDAGFSRVAALRWFRLLFTSMLPTPAHLRTEEDQVARAVAPFGRMVALGRTSDRLPRLGAERHYASDQTWKAEVLAALDRAALVLLATGAGRNLGWEVNEVVGRDDPTRLVLLVSRNRRQYAEFQKAFGKRFPNGLPDYPPTRMRHLLLRGRYVRAAIWFDSDWTPHWEMLDGRFPTIGLARRTQRALPRALRKVYQRADVPARITPTTPRPWAAKLSVLMIAVFWLSPIAAAWLFYLTFTVVKRGFTSGHYAERFKSLTEHLYNFFTENRTPTESIYKFVINVPPLLGGVVMVAVIVTYAYRVWRGGPYAIMMARIIGIFVISLLVLVVLVLPIPLRLALIAVGLLVLSVLSLPVTAMLLLRRDVRDWVDSRL